MHKSNNKKSSSNILYKNIKEFNVKLIVIAGVIFIMLSGFTSYALFYNTIISNNIINLKVGKINKSKIFTYTGDCEEYNVKQTGSYKIEAWGASGGGANAGLGGYTSGVIKLTKGETLYVCVGGKGGENATSANKGGFNGGGYSGDNGNVSYGGGGASDIRLVDGAWNDATSLNSRIMVAAGGAGGYTNITTIAGSGGGLYGENGTTSYSDYNTSTYLTTGGSQTSGGYSYNSGKGGSFGYAAQSNYSGGWGGGGGGGYYGGGMGYGATGAGGSSFISGYAGANAITSSTDRTHANSTLHYSGKYFTNTEMKIGVNSGDGKVIIEKLTDEVKRENEALNGIRYIKDCASGNDINRYNSWVEIQAIYNGTNVAKGKTLTLTGTVGDEGAKVASAIVDGDIKTANYVYLAGSDTQCVTVDLGKEYDLEEIAVWHYWGDGRTYKDNYTYVSSDNTDWTIVIDKQEPETSEGKRVNAYEKIEGDLIVPSGECEEYTIEKTGYYKLEAWGAEGGNGYYGSKIAKGGKGGYSKGITKLTKGETLYICVGEQGTNGYMPSSSGTTSTSAAGYNGGGIGYNRYEYSAFGCGGGGGATDIRLTSGTWDNETGLNSRLMVAAGGGGGCLDWSGSDSTYSYYAGGAAGGLIGKTGSRYSSSYSPGTGGTQTSGGTGGSNSSSSFGTGGNGTNASNTAGGGGGSGYYGGGGSGGWASAGGGSSFISGYAGVNAITSSTDRTHTNDTLHYSNKYFIQGETLPGINVGSGRARITYISETKPERTNTALNKVRYIKDCATGNSVNEYNSWVELQAISNGINVAKGKTLTLTGTVGDEGAKVASAIVDGDITTANYVYLAGDATQCVTVDLGKEYELDEIAVWHYWGDGRTYKDNYTYVSTDNTNWIKVIDKEEAETSEGKRVNAYEGINIKINQTKGGTITCTNNTTGQSSTTSLSVIKGDSITCRVNLTNNYELTSLKIGNDSINDNEEFIYDYKGNTEVNAKYYCNDTEGPTLTISNSNSEWTFGPVYITATATDPSGVSTIYYRYNTDSESTKRTDFSSLTNITNGKKASGTWSAARDNYVYITAIDTLGNSTTVSTRVRIKSCDCMYRSSTYKSVPQWYHSACGSYHSTAYLHLCYCSDGSIYNCTSSGWSDAGGSGCYVHTGYNAYTGISYSWSNYSGSYW